MISLPVFELLSLMSASAVTGYRAIQAFREMVRMAKLGKSAVVLLYDIVQLKVGQVLELQPPENGLAMFETIRLRKLP